MKKRSLALLACLCLLGPRFVVLAQDLAPVGFPSDEYARLKISGELPPNAYPLPAPGVVADVKPRETGGGAKGGGAEHCGCWIEPDQTYTLINNSNQWNASGFHNGDDGSHGPIALPFSFNLYGDQHSSAFININGNISFGNYYSQFSAAGFPSSQHVMVAPFWGDVHLVPANQNGYVYFKVTPTAFYVNWVDVGYFNQHNDKVNNFQLIITDGTDPVIGIGKNVSFCYKDMQWTTGDASGGSGGFGGTPATVGANRGNGVDFIQFGRFNLAGNAYDGPFGSPDGIDWLDYKNFVFTTSVSTQNIPPIASSLYLCDTIEVCVGESIEIQMDFLSPEQDQVTEASSSAPGLSNYTEVTNTSGITATIVAQFSPLPGEEGYHVITFSGTDNGDPPLTSVVDIVVHVSPGPPVPDISGPALVCSGDQVVLTAAPEGAGTFNWSNNTSGPATSVGPGTYTVTLSQGGCSVSSEPFTVEQAPDPETPVITGPATTCSAPVELAVADVYETYGWSTGDTTATTFSGPGTVVVTVTNEFGCEATSLPFVVEQLNEVFPVIVGDTLACEGETLVLGTSVPFDTYLWSTGETTSTITIGPGAGVEVVSVFVTSNDGCEGTSPEVTVTISPTPTAFFTSDPASPQGPGTTVAFTDASNGNGFQLTGWQWTILGPDSLYASTQDLTEMFSIPGSYNITLMVTNEHGCSAMFQMNYLIRPDSVEIPNVFTPNGDGTNDALVFENVQYYSNHLTVFNRWGVKVFEKDNYSNNWRATDVPDGTYYFVLRLKEEERDVTGHVTILR